MNERTGCHGCVYAQWDSEGCTCRIDGLLVWNPTKGCKHRKPELTPTIETEILRLLNEIDDTVTEAKNVQDIPFWYYDFITKKLQEIGNIIKGGVNNGKTNT